MSKEAALLTKFSANNRERQQHIMGSKYLITGGTGSFGRNMLSWLLANVDCTVVILSRDEDKQFSLRNQFNDPRINYRIGDIRDRSSVDDAMRGVDYVFHAAALKQVPSCEFFPMQAVATNVQGSYNVIRSAIKSKVKQVVCLSTDKAVFPVNSMGMSKAMMEKVAQASARELGPDSTTKINCIRYGNVLCSRGSVVPLFISQIESGTPITMTVPRMTRFLMPLRDSVALVNYAFEHGKQGDLFIRKAKASTLLDLSQAVKNILKVPEHPVKIIGWRHGEKMHESLASSQELSNAEELESYWRIPTDLRGLDYKPYYNKGSDLVTQFEDFNSDTCENMSVAQIEELLLSLPEISEKFI